MIKELTSKTNILFIVFISSLILSCSTIPDLKVTYRPPMESNELKGKEVFITLQDARAVKDIIGKGAQDDYEHFSGLLSYYVAGKEGKGMLLGDYDISFVFRNAFKRRLQRLGASVVPERKEDQLVFHIQLNRFLLDRVGRDWVIDIDYKLSLSKNGRLLSVKKMSGEAERLKLMGRGQADIAVSELFTDIINKVDLADLFQKAGY